MSGRAARAPFALALLACAAAASVPCAAQPAADAAGLRAVYGLDEPFATTFRVLDRTSYPAFVALPVGMGAHALLTDGSVAPALRVAASEAAVVALVLPLKSLVHRPRPYAAMPGVVARTGGTHPRASMPSGHSALAFASATSVALSHPKAALPAFAWASGVAAARVWHGVHYPSDVLAGAAIGAGVAYGVHRVLPNRVLELRDGSASRAPSGVVVPLGTVRWRF